MDEDTKTNVKRLGIVAGVLVVVMAGFMLFRSRESKALPTSDKGWYEAGSMTKDGKHFADAQGHVTPPPPGFKPLSGTNASAGQIAP